MIQDIGHTPKLPDVKRMEQLRELAHSFKDIGHTPKLTDVKRMEQLRELAHSFEGIFFQMIQKSMRTTIKPSGLMGGGQAEAVFTQLFDAEISERGAQRSEGMGLGIAESILNTYGKRIMKEAAPEKSFRDWKA